MDRRPLPAEVSQHKEILLLCARTRLAATAKDRIRALVSTEKDFAGLTAAAADHCVAPLVCRHLTTAASEELPPVWREQLRDEFLLNTRRNLFLTGGMFQVLDAFGQRGIRAVPHKGPSLAALAYGDIALRQFADLDFLLPQPEISNAHEALLGLGYRSEIEWKNGPDPDRIPGHYVYANAGGNVTVELHTPATLRYFPRPLPLHELFLHLEPIEIGGRRIEVLAREDALPLLCVHGAKHMWDHLSWIADISELVQGPAEFDFERSFSLSRRLGAERMTLLGLAVAQRLLDTPLPEEVASRIAREVCVNRFVDEIALRFFQAKQERPNALNRFWTRVRMGGGAWIGLRYGLRILAVPTEEDWEEFALPRGLESLYGVLRPLRFLRERGAASEEVSKGDPISGQVTLPEPVMVRMMELAHISAEDLVLDMTWDQGRAAVRAAQEYGARSLGFARTARDVAEAKIRARAAGVQRLVRFFECEPEESHFAEATVILLGRNESSGSALSGRAREKLLPGTRVVSCAAGTMDWPSAKQEHVQDRDGNCVPVYFWERH